MQLEGYIVCLEMQNLSDSKNSYLETEIEEARGGGMEKH